MTGEVLRLRTLTSYGVVKRPKTGVTSYTLTVRGKKHLVVVAIALIPETMEIDHKFVEERMREMGWEKAR